MAVNINPKVVVAVLVFVLFFLFVVRPRSSGYAQAPLLEPMNSAPSPIITYNTVQEPSMAMDMDVQPQTSEGWGVSTSMLPREIPSQEDFGSFSPDDIMKGQTYLDPRAQIGYPETIGGVLRNASWDLRSEPPNPRTPISIFNNSTIVPDLMRPQFEIGRTF
jgi:hypothetical protein